MAEEEGYAFTKVVFKTTDMEEGEIMSSDKLKRRSERFGVQKNDAPSVVAEAGGANTNSSQRGTDRFYRAPQRHSAPRQAHFQHQRAAHPYYHPHPPHSHPQHRGDDRRRRHEGSHGHAYGITKYSKKSLKDSNGSDNNGSSNALPVVVSFEKRDTGNIQYPDMPKASVNTTRNKTPVSALIRVDTTLPDVSTLGLTDEQREIWDKNPHLRQVFATKREFQRAGRELSETDRKITPASGREKYSRRNYEAKTVELWKQRDLLIAAIDFLTDCYNPNESQIVVYAGAAPAANHLHALITLFPALNWILFDPKDLIVDSSLDGNEKVKLIQESFTVEKARQIRNENPTSPILLISNIRSIPIDVQLTLDEKSSIIMKDMKLQEEFTYGLHPNHAMLKFWLPYQKGATRYLDGELRFPAFGHNTATNTYLLFSKRDATATNQLPTGSTIVFDPYLDDNSYGRKSYDHSEYEETMFYFNVHTRTTHWEHDYCFDNYRNDGGDYYANIIELDPTNVKIIPIDHCFDCALELYILRKYITKLHGEISSESVKAKVTEVSVSISEMLKIKQGPMDVTK